MIFKITVLLLIATISDIIKAQFFCKNRHGKRVDWFVGYKQPKNKSQIYPGATFHYADQDSTEWGSAENLKSPKNAIAKPFYFFYNDQKPNKESRSHGNHAHAKGVAIFGDTSGFWLIHSVPKFPSLKHYFYAQNGEIYGQSFMCVTLKTTSIEIFAEAMKYIYPAVYGMNVPKTFLARFPFLNDLKQLKKKNIANTSLMKNFKSNDGMIFYNFAKSDKYKKDLYSDMIARQMKVSLFTETWMNGGAKDLDSDCSTAYKVMNVMELNVAGNKFANKNDHSKWAIAENETKPLVCVGDINRQESQKNVEVERYVSRV
ncbi:deoxyribonuclease II family protein [Loa loa]|uniref:Deoxyribonuclease II family protein n=1 Tax=Loa loa TaxID=7209 RepID=A0A1S0TKK1_LOALO|nr:deoxyribonuclease II family protein [Loa loa]EFO15122.1 deoxyribonuclease II family protein [Loa loa]